MTPPPPPGDDHSLPAGLARFEALRRVATALAETDSLPIAFQTIVDAAAQALDAHTVTLSALDLNKTQVDLIVRSGSEADPAAAPSSQQPAQADIETNDAAWNTLTVPVIYCEWLLGMIKATNPPGEPAFTPEDETFLTALASLAALAIEADHLRQKESRQRRQAETLREVARILNLSLDRQQVLELILDQLARVVEYDSASIMLLNDQNLTVAAARNITTADQKSAQSPLEDYPHILEAIERRQPVIIEDTRLDRRWRPLSENDSIRCWLGVPLIGRDRVIGVLNLDKEQPGFYTRADARLAAIFAGQAATSIENARAYTLARDAAERRSVLHQVSQAIVAASLKPEEIYTAIHTAAARLMTAEAFVITRYQPGSSECEAVYQVDRGRRFPSVVYPADSGLFGRVIASQKTVYIPDMLQDREPEMFPHFGGQESVRAVLSAPMRLRGEVVGMIAAQSYRPDPYTANDQSLLEMLAAYAAIALDNASLFQNIQQLAITDSLTGLFNRRQLFDLGQREFLRAWRFRRPLSALMIDIDYFKQVNDRFSHATGDRVLRGLAGVLKGAIREIDIVGRYGGEEFVVVLPEAGLDTAVEIANRLRDHTQAAFESISLPTITISIGVAQIGPTISDFADLIHRADLALYDAKHAGRNRVATYLG